MKVNTLTPLAAAMGCLALAASANAADKYWTGTGNWSNASWATSSGGTYNTNFNSGDNAIFEGSTGTVSVSGTVNVGNLSFNSNSDNYMIQDGTLNVSGNINRTVSNREHKITSAITGTPTVNNYANGDKTYWFIGTQNMGMYRGLDFSPTSGAVNLGTVNNPVTAAGGDKSGLFLGGTTVGNTVAEILRPGGNYGSVGKYGSGEWTVNGDIATGFLAINEGKLAINGTVTATYQQFSMAAEGTLAPGASIGTAAFNQYWRNIESGATAEFEFLNNGTAGTTYDQVVLNGGAYWDLDDMTGVDKFNIDLVGMGGYAVNDGETFQLISGDVRNFDADKFNIMGTEAGNWEVSGVGGVMLTYIAPAAAVPEPSTTALLGLGGLALIFRRRK